VTKTGGVLVNLLSSQNWERDRFPMALCRRGETGRAGSSLRPDDPRGDGLRANGRTALCLLFFGGLEEVRHVVAVLHGDVVVVDDEHVAVD